MGGLVCRNFIRRHKAQWDAMAGQDGSRGGRLVMLGTPNYGSFAIVQAMTGDKTMVKVLAAADLTKSLSEVLGVIDTFVGSYQMLPWASKIPDALSVLFRRGNWGSCPVSVRHLARALQFQQEMGAEVTVDPGRMVYIAGCNRETVSGLRVMAPGEFDYVITHDGDGRVPHALGLLPGVPTYYVDESHGSLPKNAEVLVAVDELLEHGRTAILSDRPILSRGIRPEGSPWRRPPGEQDLGERLKALSEGAKEKKVSAAELRFAEETIMGSVMGQDRAAPSGPAADGRRKPPGRGKPIPLHIEAVRADVTQVEAPVVVVGHYKGGAPVSAEGEIDKALGFWISRLGRQGIIGADLGETFFIPVPEKAKKQIAAKAVILAGMGEEGRFGREDLRYLTANVATAVSAQGLDGFATVLIGSGAGNLSKERALRAMVEGVGDALTRLPERERIAKMTVVECDPAVYEEILKTLNRIAAAPPLPRLALKVTDRKLPPPRRRPAKERPADIPSEPLPGARITVERDRTKFRFSALSRDAVIPVREVDVQPFFVSGAAERLMASTTLREQEEYGQLLAALLIPQDFRPVIDGAESLTLILDRATASLPWEMACFRRSGGPVFLGRDLKLARQFRTMLASPGLPPPLNRNLKVLVIADPAPEPEYQLPGARAEGREVVAVLNGFKRDLDLTVVDRIGAAACDPVEILALLFNEEFDIVHYAGHGTFDEKDPSGSGWVFGEGRILSAKEIFRARRVPRLVFANACFSSAIRERRAMAPDEMNRRLAGMAEAFFERGVLNYIGAGWPVDDAPAKTFASVFYKSALTGETLGDSLAAARDEIKDQGSTWGAYQHYGQVNGVVITKA
jgi:hypothetical protein